MDLHMRCVGSKGSKWGWSSLHDVALRQLLLPRRTKEVVALSRQSMFDFCLESFLFEWWNAVRRGLHVMWGMVALPAIVELGGQTWVFLQRLFFLRKWTSLEKFVYYTFPRLRKSALALAFISVREHVSDTISPTFWGIATTEMSILLSTLRAGAISILFLETVIW